MRYLPLTEADRDAMIATIGAASVEDLFADVPPSARLTVVTPNTMPGLTSDRLKAVVPETLTVSGSSIASEPAPRASSWIVRPSNLLTVPRMLTLCGA